MPYSDTRFDEITCALLRVTWRKHKPAVLDIGAGAGKYARILAPLVAAIDGVEVFRKYIYEFDLHAKYREIFCDDIRGWSPGQLSGYDLLIAGDVLEHMAVAEARKLIANATLSGCAMMVQVPFLCEQGEENGNVYEKHLQSDLTREVMGARYPELFEVHADERLGLYVL